MASNYAQIENNIVKQVIVADSLQWCVDNLGGEWVDAYYDTEGKNPAGKGHDYVPEKDNFRGPKMFDSWTLGDDCKWHPPVARPEDGKWHDWNEEKQEWVLNPKIM